MTMTLHTAMDAHRERDHLTEITLTIEQATGCSPRGWPGPALTETRIRLGCCASWASPTCSTVNHDQPYPLTVDGMISVPDSAEPYDVPLSTARNLSRPEYARLVVHALNQLLHDGKSGGRVMARPLHLFIVNQPSRHRYLAEAREHVAGHPGVWVTTSD